MEWVLTGVRELDVRSLFSKAGRMLNLNIDPYPRGSATLLPVSTLSDLPSALWSGFPIAVTGHKQVNRTYKTATALNDISKWVGETSTQMAKKQTKNTSI